MKYDINSTHYIDGKPIVIPGQPLEPPIGWYDAPYGYEEECEDDEDDIDLEQWCVFRFGGNRK